MTTLEEARTRTRSGPFTWADIADLPEDGLRREIIGGQLIVSSSPIHRHQRVLLRLAVVLEAAQSDDVETVIAPFDWRYDPDGVVEPDLLVCRLADLDLDDRLLWSAVPVLLVEILSPSNSGYDRLLKRELYERLGVPNYWMVDPGAANRDPAITALGLDDDGSYQVAGEANADETFTTEHPFPVSFTPADLLDGRHRS